MGANMQRTRSFIRSLGLLMRDLLQPTNLLAVVVLLILLYVGVTYMMAKFREARIERERRELETAVSDLTHKNDALRQAVRLLEAQCEELKGFVKRLTTESRVADVRVVGHRLDSQKKPIWTLEFTELGRDGKPLPAKVLTVRGQDVYFDALIIKFSHDLVKVGDPLRGKSLHFFRRAFGSAQTADDGPMLAASGDAPDAYRNPSGSASAFEHALWLRFWYWVNHPTEAEAEGIRVAEGQAVFTRPEPGATYRITLEHAGGLNIKRMVPKNP